MTVDDIVITDAVIIDPSTFHTIEIEEGQTIEIDGKEVNQQFFGIQFYDERYQLICRMKGDWINSNNTFYLRFVENTIWESWIIDNTKYYEVYDTVDDSIVIF